MLRNILRLHFINFQLYLLLYFNIILLQKKKIVEINNIEELKYAGVLATGGFMDTVEDLSLEREI